jgi:hypothetical protein
MGPLSPESRISISSPGQYQSITDTGIGLDYILLLYGRQDQWQTSGLDYRFHIIFPQYISALFQVIASTEPNKRSHLIPPNEKTGYLSNLFCVIINLCLCIRGI